MKTKNTLKNILMMSITGFTLMFFTNVSFAEETGKVNVETANLRETADEESRILVQLSIDDNVEILGESGNWYEVKLNDVTGYVRKDLLTVENKDDKKDQEQAAKENTTNQEEQTTTENNTQKVEAKEQSANRIVKEDSKLKIVPSINATDIIEVKKDDEVTVIEEINDWVCIEKETAKGWIRSDKLMTAEEKNAQEQAAKEAEEAKQKEQTVQKTMYISETRVNLRKEPKQDSESLAKLTLNTQVDVYSEENGWSKVKVNGTEGYILSSLLSDSKKEETVTSRSATTSRKEQTTTKKEEAKQETKKETNSNPPVSGKGSTVIETAKKYLGAKYVYGASGPNSFDCSGFTSYVFKLHGVSLNRTAKAQYSNGTAVSRANLQPGDLVMFGPSASGINHVGIYIGGGKIIHAENPSSGVTIDTINSGYYNKNYVGARRVI